jgi:hypothetical protein
MSAPVYHYPNPSGSAITVDSDSPNTTSPTDMRRFAAPTGRDSTASSVCAVAIGGTITLQLWGYVVGLKRWAQIGSPVVVAADTVVDIATPPTDMPSLYAQVTAVTGATGFALMYRGAR